MNRLAKMIKEAREEKNLTEKALAKKCGVGENYIKEIESGRKVIREDIAEKILQKLGKRMDSYDMEKTIAEERKKNTPEKSYLSKKQEPEKTNYDLKPTATWSKALDSLVKNYPVIDMNQGKQMGIKTLPVIDSKVEGHHPDKLSFYQVGDNSAKALRFEKGDLVTILETKEIENGGIYLLEGEKGKMIRRIRKEPGGVLGLSRGIDSEGSIKREKNKMTVIGKCIKVEYRME